MKCNVGKTDRMARFLVGIVIIAVGLYYQSWWGLVGVLPIITGAIRWCPPYQLLGISTDKES